MSKKTSRNNLSQIMFFRAFYERSRCSTMLETMLNNSRQKYKNQRKRWLTFGNRYDYVLTFEYLWKIQSGKFV